MKDFSKGLKTARKNTVEDSPLLAQHDEFMENEVINGGALEAEGAGEVLATADPAPAQKQVYDKTSAKKNDSEKTEERTKGVVVDIPWSNYCVLRDMKDELPNATLKKLVLQAIDEFVKRELKKRNK